MLEAAAKRFDIPLEIRHFEWASCDYYAAHGQMMPDDWKAQLDNVDAIFFGRWVGRTLVRITFPCGVRC